ncbi:MAG: N-acetyl-gamma-glutamyl-phosphate reductase [Lachnospiraceae bacterium]|nr:N-acetyl-gamma-glutamyl-phosphate reductase [Lachnospiraceae bacterium]
MVKVFIDGSAGTTGLRINERLSDREDIELLKISEKLRKDNGARKDMINEADIVFLCLPDDAAIEAASFVNKDNDHTVIIDTSTAHRVNDAWAYGFPELTGLREKIKNSQLIANPGCHASGFISLVAPLVEAKIIPKQAELSCFSLTGYSGGGKKMIAEYESEGRNPLLDGPRQYGISQSHKHLPEMKKTCGLENSPVFCPIVADFYAGMEVTVPLFHCDIDAIKAVYKEYYSQGNVFFNENADENGYMSAAAYAGRDDMEISVQGNNERVLLVSRFDNLGKGASGAAIQNMNIVLGIDEGTGLTIMK